MTTWKLVPILPTLEMVRAAYAEQPGTINAGFDQAYRTMVEHAPTPLVPASVWRPLSEAKRDGTPYLLKFKADAASQVSGVNKASGERLSFKNGAVIAVMQNQFGRSWQFAARVGVGGFPDDWFEGFMELPE